MKIKKLISKLVLIMLVVGVINIIGQGKDSTLKPIQTRPSISGYVKTSDGRPIKAVTITFSNNGGTATTYSNGYYIKFVPSGWSGTATPSKQGYTFYPTYRSYSNVTSKKTNQNYVGNMPPLVTITSPKNGATFAPGATITFTGYAIDPEDGVLSGSSLVWVSNKDGEIGTGNSISKSTLLAGEHIITLTATDSDGATRTATVRITSGGLANDFQPCSGRPSNPSYVETCRLLIATSNDGLNFTRTNDILADRASVPDAVVLNNGRILVYFVAAGKIVNGQEIKTNETVMAVSDDNGKTWVYKNVTFNGVPSGATFPVDPNVVLTTDGNLRLFTTIDPDTTGPQKARTYSFLSTDGGFTYEMEGERFALPNRDVLDPENFQFSETNWQLWAGTQHATSPDGYNFTYEGEVQYAPVVINGMTYYAVVADITKFPTYYRMYVHGSSPNPGDNYWIKSLTSIDTYNWTLEQGNRLTIAPSTGKESSDLMFPTVVSLNDGTYLMIYQTIIP